MPTVYTWYPTFQWYDFSDPDYRWFYNMLLVATNAAQHTPEDIPIISFVHRTTTSPPKEPDPEVKQFSEEKYRELLWHMLLRGVDGFFLWCPQKELVQEIKPVLAVYGEALEYKEFLDQGKPVTFAVPKTEGPVVSGLKLGQKVLVRRTDFGPVQEPVRLRVEGLKIKIAPVQGKCQILTMR
jgi:hypothetical protein